MKVERRKPADRAHVTGAAFEGHTTHATDFTSHAGAQRAQAFVPAQVSALVVLVCGCAVCGSSPLFPISPWSSNFVDYAVFVPERVGLTTYMPLWGGRRCLTWRKIVTLPRKHDAISKAAGARLLCVSRHLLAPSSAGRNSKAAPQHGCVFCLLSFGLSFFVSHRPRCYKPWPH